VQTAISSSKKQKRYKLLNILQTKRNRNCNVKKLF